MTSETAEKSDEKAHDGDGHDGGHHDAERVAVTLLWTGTGESATELVKTSETAGEVFNDVYEHFHHKPSDQDTFEVNETPFPRSEFGATVEQLLHKFGPDLVFEVIPPTSGA